MKYFYSIVIIFLLSSCTYSQSPEDYNYLPNNSLRFIKRQDDTSILINKDNKYYLLLLGHENIKINVDYLIKYQDVKTSIKAEEEYYLKNTITIDDVTFKINNKIEIILNNREICIYVKELSQDDFHNCEFIYLYNPDSAFYITLNNRLSVLFYNAYTRFNYRFLYHMATTWIDTYTIDDSSYLTLSISPSSFAVKADKIRGKTIHKKEKT